MLMQALRCTGRAGRVRVASREVAAPAVDTDATGVATVTAAGAGRQDRPVGNVAHAIWRGSKVVLVTLHNRELITDAENDELLADLARLLEDPAALDSLRLLAISDGGGPTARQRERVKRLLAERAGAPQIPWVLISTSRFARGVANALAYVLGGFRAYGPADLGRAVAYLQLDESELPQVWRVIQELDRGLGLETVAELRANQGQPA
jgi:hypothetical protein